MSDKIVALPGVVPRTLVNRSAADDLQEVVDRLRSGEIAGVAWVSVWPNGRTSHGWNTPTNMGKLAFVGVSSLAFKMMKEMEDG